MLCKVEEIADGAIRECDAGKGRKVCVARSGGEFFAFQAKCPHRQLSMCDASIDGAVVTCLGHLWQWDARSGEPQGFAEESLETYRVQRVDDALYLKE